MSTENLIFFDKNGNNVNLNYNEDSEKYEGRLFFDENSDDTFKTITLNTFERIEPFDFQLNDGESDELFLNKFQLFNEFGIDYQGTSFKDQKVELIEVTNEDPSFYSKWIYGENFESKFPKGTEIKFNEEITEFNSLDRTYTVVGSKKGAIMIISNMDNDSYEATYNGLTSSAYDEVTVDGINAIQIRKYVDQSVEPNLSEWSEPFFYDKIFEGQKLSVINSENNNGVFTVKEELQDNNNYTYIADGDNLGLSQSFIVELTLLTDLPSVYRGSLNIDGTNQTITFPTKVPLYLRPGVEFTISNSILNQNKYIVDDIETFDRTPGKVYATGSLVLYEGEVYENIQSYTQSTSTLQSSTNLSGSSPNTTLNIGTTIDPEDTDYWQISDYIPVVQNLTTENILNSKIYLTSNVIYLETPYDTNSEITLSESVDQYQDELSFFDISYTYENNKVEADLNFSSKYAQVKFYNGNLSNNITNDIFNYERVIEVEEDLTPENNKNISERDLYSIIIDDIDEFGLYVTINGLEYYVDTSFVFNGVNIDLKKTVDKTLRSWVKKYSNTLLKLGILVEVVHTGYITSPYVNTLKLRTVYPNVPLEFNIRVGSTANYIIEHSEVTIYDMGDVLNIIINESSYVEEFDTDISTTLSNWIDSHSEFLFDIGILVSSNNQVLVFDVKEQNTLLNYEFRLGKPFKPGEDSFKIVNRQSGNEGNLITANEIIHNTNGVNFEDEGFSTGQIVSINNSFFTLNNREYNILFLDPDKMTLSYDGPFWGNTQSDILSGFLGYAFDDGFGYDPNVPNLSSPISPTFSANIIGTSSNMVDIDYIQPTENIFTLGDTIEVLDATDSNIVDTLLGSTSSVKSEINPVNQLLYALTDNMVYYIDPVLEQITGTISLPSTGYDIDINDNNGDVYVSYSDSPQVSIYDINNNLISGVSLTTNSNTLEFNPFEDKMFISEPLNNQVTEVDGDSRSIVDTFTVTGTSEEIYYNPFNNQIYGFDNTSLYTISSGSLSSIGGVTTATSSWFTFDPINDKMIISTSDDIIYEVDGLDNLVGSTNVGYHGYLLFNNFDGNIYIASDNTSELAVYSTVTHDVFLNINLNGIMSKMVYNQYRQTIVGIIPSSNEIIEFTINALTSPSLRGFSSAFSSSFFVEPSSNPCKGIPVNESFYGSLKEEYCNDDDLLILKVREYIRRPRANFETDNDVQVNYKWHWIDDQTPDIFIYDITGDQLETTGPYAYTGEKPLTDIILNRTPNRDIMKTNDPRAQQTVFDEITYTLDYVDSSDNFNFVPKPLQTHIGFNSKQEGVKSSILLLTKMEDIEFDITPNLTNDNNITFKVLNDNEGNSWGEIKLNGMSQELFNDKNLKVGQILQIFVEDRLNENNQYISKNYGLKLKIRDVFVRSIIVDFIERPLIDEKTIIEDYPQKGETTYLTTTFKVADKVIANFNVFGQTEIEDIRYKIELNNTGKNIKPEDVYIFKEYDISEQGIDWTFLNKKRKEMLLVRPDIFDYIGSYKAIINAINYFGYNDLELYEYFRNVKRDSENFNKLVKTEIPDIFDPSLPGWSDDENLLNVLPNAEYEETKLFNLAYNITDRDGNFVLNYTLDEVIIKLMGLKKWLEKNVIPISHNILDITGRTHTRGATTIYHDHYDVEVIKSTNSMTPMNFDINEAYILPVNSGSTVYNVVLDFNTQTSEETPDYFTVKIRTYQILPSWEPFKRYNEGDEIKYFGKHYESVEDDNITNNPREFQDTSPWREDNQYIFGQEVEYNRDIYQYQNQLGATSGTFSATQSSQPPFDNDDWFRVNNWREIDLEPVQTISEYRDGDDLNPYNFTLDTNIDPYVIVEVTSDNGYGQNYTVRKSVEVRLDADSDELLVQ